ncbi:MAG: hypothetical protein RR678_08255 [Lachnospiraceae bacterium]
MYLKQTPNKKGRIYLSIIDSYYDKTTKNSKHKTIESLGYLDELQKIYADPISHFQHHVVMCTPCQGHLVFYFPFNLDTEFY